ncbi:hypothetical protein [Agrobacterium sp. 22-209-1]
MESIEACYIDQSPTEFVDDLKVKTLTDELLIQMKSGRIDWVSVVADFKIQELHDDLLGRDLKYMLVNGSAQSLASLQEKLRAKGLPTAQAQLFAYPESFPDYLRQNGRASSSLEQLTGSPNVLDYETAYRALVYVIIVETGKISFVNLLKKASERVYDFLTPLDKYDTYKDFEDLIRIKVPDLTVRVSGRLLHLEDSGFLQTFIIPLQLSLREGFRDWLDNQNDPLLGDLENALHFYRWNEVDRSEHAQRAD